MEREGLEDDIGYQISKSMAEVSGKSFHKLLFLTTKLNRFVLYDSKEDYLKMKSINFDAVVNVMEQAIEMYEDTLKEQE